MDRTVIGSFENYAEAQAVVNELTQQGFGHEDISIVAKDKESGSSARDTEGGDVGSGAMKGALTGGAIGGALGLAAGVAALAIPGIGPILAAGPIATALMGAGAGAVAGGLIGALSNMGVNEEDAHYYAESVRRGGALVIVKTDEGRAQLAADIMQRHGAIDIDRQSQEWRQAGWKSFDPNAEPYTASAESQEEVIPIVQEELKVGKREVERGRVRVYTHMVATPVEAQVSLRDETIQVERRPVNRPATEQDLATSSENKSLEFRETDEEAIVQKQANVVEEVSVSKDVRQRQERIEDSVRRTEVDIEESQTSQPAPPKRRPRSDKPFRH